MFHNLKHNDLQSRHTIYLKEINMALNLKTVAVGDTTRVHLVDANDEKLYDDGKPAEIEIYGKASKQYRQALSALSRKNVLRKGKTQSFETNVEDNVDLLVAISKAAHNFDMGNGPIDSVEAFKALYSDASLFFIKDAVQAALEDNANFTQK